MAAPAPPVLKNEAICNRDGVLVSWISAQQDDSVAQHTVVYKADAWWTSSSATVPGQMSEFLIQGLPANAKVSVWVYTTNPNGASAYSNQCDFVTSRDCGLEGAPEADIQEDVDMNADELFDVLYTEPLDKYVAENGLVSVSSVEIISYEQKEDGFHKLARVTPKIPERIRSMLESYMGDTVLKYDELSVKNFETKTIEFKIDNVPLVQQYVEKAGGKMVVLPLTENRCRFEVFFDLRINYPVIGYYIAQVIRSSAMNDLRQWPHHTSRYLRERNAGAE